MAFAIQNTEPVYEVVSEENVGVTLELTQDEAEALAALVQTLSDWSAPYSKTFLSNSAVTRRIGRVANALLNAGISKHITRNDKSAAFDYSFLNRVSVVDRPAYATNGGSF